MRTLCVCVGIYMCVCVGIYMLLLIYLTDEFTLRTEYECNVVCVYVCVFV